jgi:IS5 family transposase
MEEALYEIAPLRQFAGLSLLEAIPDETTMLHFRHLLERHALGAKMLASVNADLAKRGLLLRQGTIVDATIIHAPSSTKNSSGTRDPEMRQTKKGNQWFFGLKAHIGVDRHCGLVHTVVTTAANVADVTQTDALLHGKEKAVFGDAGYTGADKREELKDKRIDWHIAERRHKVKALPEGELKEVTVWLEHLRAKVRARVEHPFRVIKQQFGFQKVRYRGLAKNGAQLNLLFALANLWMARGRLLAMTG